MNELNCLRTKGYPYFALTCRSDTDKDDIWNDTFGSRERYATVFVHVPTGVRSEHVHNRSASEAWIINELNNRNHGIPVPAEN